MSTLRVYTLGDSNGAGPDGWPTHLAMELERRVGRRVELVNDSLPGRAIGFQKFGPDSNALNVAEESVRAAARKLGGLDEVVVCLGTNDVQTMWAAEGKTAGDIAKNLDLLCRRIREGLGGARARVTICSPPPLGSVLDEDAAPAEGKVGDEQNKRRGGGGRLAMLTPLMQAVAAEHGARFVDLFGGLHDRRDQIVGEDGTHLTKQGQQCVAGLMAETVAG